MYFNKKNMHNTSPLSSPYFWKTERKKDISSTALSFLGLRNVLLQQNINDFKSQQSVTNHLIF